MNERILELLLSENKEDNLLGFTLLHQDPKGAEELFSFAESLLAIGDYKANYMLSELLRYFHVENYFFNDKSIVHFKLTRALTLEEFIEDTSI